MGDNWPCVLFVGADLTDIFALYGCDRDGLMRVHEGTRFIYWEDIMKGKIGDEIKTDR